MKGARRKPGKDSSTGRKRPESGIHLICQIENCYLIVPENTFPLLFVTLGRLPADLKSVGRIS